MSSIATTKPKPHTHNFSLTLNLNKITINYLKWVVLLSLQVFDGDDLTATGSLDPEKPKSANFSKTMSTKLIWYEYHLFLHALSLSRTLKYAPQLGIMIFFYIRIYSLKSQIIKFPSTNGCHNESCSTFLLINGAWEIVNSKLHWKIIIVLVTFCGSYCIFSRSHGTSCR